ncbi:MAG: hypothetical protein J6Y93_02290 [Treponema sp.]|nr:hypothetical protein [Treponema sp.]
MLRRFITLVTFIFCAAFISAHGKGDIDERKVENMDSWQETFDINEKKAGKYNILVTVDDQGGNTSVGGPFNIFIDPESDYPVSGITNPIKDMRVPGNLNIVGTCIDDDGVKEVYLILDGDYENPVKAKGKEFWSHYLDTTLLDEGPHTIEVYGVDVNDLSSAGKANKIDKVTWNLDRRQPVTAVTNHGLGQLVSGKINLRGTVNDGNGIKSLSYSLDGGQKVLDAKIAYDKNANLWTFDIPVNTKEYPDGPSVIWFRATDKMGSVGVYSYLYFIDNTKPEVRVVYPSKDDTVNGKFGVAGYAKDTIGIKKLSWSFNGKSGDFELVPGNPYWYVEVDSKGLNKSADFIITAVDTVNNEVIVKHSIKINQDQDKPVTAIMYPEKGAVIEGDAGTVFIRGIAADDDGLATITYKLDNGAEQTVEAQGVFYAPLDSDKALSYGNHTLTAYATDVNGIRGDSVSVQFTSRGAAPKFSDVKIGGKAAVSGVMVSPEANTSVETSASASCGLKSVEYKIESGSGEVFEEKTIEAKKNETSISVSTSLAKAPWGLLYLSFKATDIYDRTAEKRLAVNLKDLTYIHKDLLDEPFEAKIVNTITEESPIIMNITSVNGAEYVPGMDVIVPAGTSKSPLKLVASVECATKGLSVSYKIEGPKTAGGDEKQEGKTELKPVDATHYEAYVPLNNLPSRITKITLTANVQKTVSTTVGTICVVRPVPERKSTFGTGKIYWLPSENAEFNQSQNAYVLAAGTPFIGYANIEGPVEVVSASAGITASVEGNAVKLTAEKDGIYKNVSVRVRDSKGEISSPGVNLIVDSERPAVAITAPVNHLWAQNRTQLVVEASDANGISKVEYSIDGGATWAAAADSKGKYVANLVFERAEDGLIPVDVRATDLTGKVSYASCAVQKDTTPPRVVNVHREEEKKESAEGDDKKPKTTKEKNYAIIPCPQDIVNGENTIAFLITDAGRLAKAEYVAPKTNEKVPLELGPLIVTNIGKTGDVKAINDLMAFNFYDESGNVTSVREWPFMIDSKSDLPVAEIHLPVEDFVVTRDFEISGVVLDDDGPCKIYYKIDNGQYRLAKEELDTSFSIPVALQSMTDNEHSVTVYAVDINGTKGPEFVRNFKVSLEEPKGAVVSPTIEETVKETIRVTGRATDKNGIKAVYVSVDNGNSYNQALGTFGHDKTDTNWSYEFDTRVVQDNTHVLFIKIVDWYGIEGLYSSLINIDNTNPSINLELPLDDSTTTGMVFFSGQTTDNIGLETLFITVRSLEGKVVSKSLAHTDLVPDEIITQTLDISSLDNGFYNIELTGTDAARNVTRVSRNIQLNKNKPAAKVDLLYPLNGEHVQGNFNIYGTAVSENAVELLELYIDKNKVAETQLSDSGYYKFALNPELIADGQHNIQVTAVLKNGKKIVSNTQYLNYKTVGPWVTIDNFTYGDFAIDRPYLIGNAGYVYDEEEVVAAKMKGATKEQKAALDAKTVQKVEISFNNGKTFEQVSKNGKWRYRVENEDIAEGYHFLLVRVTMENGESAITRTIVQVDKTKPSIKLISPGEGGRYNQQLEFSGLAHDDVALKNVTLTLRKGDKASYEVPAFIQGLYFDWHFWGATLFDIGAGLTFFDDNVKLQVQWGQFTESQRKLFTNTNARYGGNVIGGKLLANVAYFPFRYYFGPDWEWLSANITLGANFSRFSESGAGKAQILSAVLGQIEFPRITFAKQKMFRTIAFYTEGQLWFIPSDVAGSDDIKSVVPQISFGIRVNVF